MYVISTQYDNPPDYLVNQVCGAIDGAPQGTDILGRVAAGLNASLLGGRSCNDIIDFELKNQSGWDWQVFVNTSFCQLCNSHSFITHLNGINPYSLSHFIQF